MTTRTRWQRALDLLRKIRHASTGTKRDRAQAAIDATKAIPAPKPPPPVKVDPLIFPAIIAARTQSQHGPAFGVGECLMRVHDCYGIGALFPDAAAAWAGAKVKHHTSDPTAIPRGYPVWWTGGSKGFGHVAISAGNGMCWSTDILRPGFFDLVAIDRIRTQWGLALVGWSEDVNGVKVVASR
jgi:cell wall-associated NlpC family hydrolase